MAREKTTHQERQIRLRLEILDELLNDNAKRNYKELLSALNKALEMKGELHISKRTLQYNISHLEYENNAPIHRPDKKDPRIYYTEKFSLKDVGLTDEEVGFLRNAIEILKQVDNFQIMADVEVIIQKLEHRVNTVDNETRAMIHFERQPITTGAEHFDNLLSAIKNKNVLRIEYQPFSLNNPNEIALHPYLLKEFRNRWFLFAAVDMENKISIFALDRIKKIKNTTKKYHDNDIFVPETYFNHLVGVSIPMDVSPVFIEIKVSKEQAPYIITKPIHNTQQIIKKYKDGRLLIKLKLIINYELKSTLLSYGPGIEIKKPILLREQMKVLLMNTILPYNK